MSIERVEDGVWSAEPAPLEEPHVATLRGFLRSMLAVLFPLGVTTVSGYLLLAAVGRSLDARHYAVLVPLVACVVVLSVPPAVLQAWAAGRTLTSGLGESEPPAFEGSWTLRWVLASSFVVLVLSPALNSFLHIGVASATGLLAAYLLVSSLSSLALGYIQNGLSPRTVIALELIRPIVWVGGGVLLIKAGLGVPGPLVAVLGGEVVILIASASILVARRRAGERNSNAGRRPFPALPPSEGLLALGLLGSFWTASHVDVLLARHFLTEQQSISYVMGWVTARVFVLPLGLAVVAILHVVATADETRNVARWIRFSLGITWGAALAAIALVVGLRTQIVTILFGHPFGQAASLAAALEVTAGLFAVGALLVQFHLRVHSHAHLSVVGALVVEIILIWAFHRTLQQVALGTMAGTALCTGLLFHAAMAISRWPRPLSALSPHEEFVPTAGPAAGPSEVLLSVVLPCHNAGSQLEAFLISLQDHLDGQVAHEIIVVSDGSTDDTVRIAGEFASGSLRVFHYADRLGKGHALRVGLNQARGEYVAFIDSDGDIDPQAIVPFLSLMKLYGPDIVLGSKRHPLSRVEYPGVRRVMSWVYHLIGRILFHINVRDTQTGLKLIRRDVLAEVLPRMLEKRYAFDLELLVVAHRLGFTRIFEAPVQIHYRFASNVNPTAALLILVDTAAIFYRRYILNSYAPSGGLAGPLGDVDADALSATEGLAVSDVTGVVTGEPGLFEPLPVTVHEVEITVPADTRQLPESPVPVVPEQAAEAGRDLRTEHVPITQERPGADRSYPGLAIVCGFLVSTGIGLWLTRNTWGSRPPAGLDVMAHLVRAQYGIDHLLRHGQLDGWFPRLMVGHQMYLIYGQGFEWLLGVIRALTLFSLSTSGALKVTSVGSFIVLPFAVAFLALSFGLNRLAAATAAVLTLGVSTPFGVGLQGIFDLGLVVNQVGAILFCLALGAVARVIDDRRARWLALASVTTAALVITHPISATILAVSLIIYVILRLLLSSSVMRSMPRLAGGLGAGLLFTAYWLLPVVVHRDLHGIAASFVHPSLGRELSQVIHGELLFRPWMAPMVVGAMGATLLAAIFGWRKGFVLAILPVAILLAVHGLAAHRSDFTYPLVNRGLGFAGILAILPLAAVIAYLGRWVPSWTALPQSLLIAGALVVVPLGPLASIARQFPQATPPMTQAAAELRTLVPVGARFTVEANFPEEVKRTGVLHPHTWLAYYSGKDVMATFFSELSPSPAGYERDQLGRKPLAESADAFNRYGVTHLVATSDRMIALLNASGRFRLVWQEGGIAIFEVVPRSGQPNPSSLLSTAGEPLTAVRVSVDPDHPRMTVDVDHPTQADIALSWSPKWHARLDGASIPIQRTKDSIMSVEIPAGAHHLALDFRDDMWDWIGRGISLLTIAGAGMAWIVRRRAGQSAVGGASEGPADVSRSGDQVPATQRS